MRTLQCLVSFQQRHGPLMLAPGAQQTHQCITSVRLQTHWLCQLIVACVLHAHLVVIYTMAARHTLLAAASSAAGAYLVGVYTPFHSQCLPQPPQEWLA
jgi:hypothetical protein